MEFGFPSPCSLVVRKEKKQMIMVACILYHQPIETKVSQKIYNWPKLLNKEKKWKTIPPQGNFPSKRLLFSLIAKELSLHSLSSTRSMPRKVAVHGKRNIADTIRTWSPILSSLSLFIFLRRRRRRRNPRSVVIK